MPAAKKKSTKTAAAKRGHVLPRKHVVVRQHAGMPPLREGGTRLLSKREVMAQLNLTFPTIYDMVRRGEFPAPLDVLGRANWQEGEIFNWMQQLKRKTYKAA